MKMIKYGAMIVVIGSLIACGHGFEGDFQLVEESSNEGANALYKALGTPTTVTIGSDYVERDGAREELDDIFVREQGDERFLVFKKDGKGEDAWRIIDKDTLVIGNEMYRMKLVRIK